MWLYYFNVDDINAAKARVRGGGRRGRRTARTRCPSGDWIIQARDPQGAMFALVGPNKA